MIVIWTTVLALMAASACHAFPDPQESSGATGRATDKCNAFQFQEWLADVNQCMTEAEGDLNELLATFGFTKQELKRAMCQGVAGKVRCMDNLSDRCLNATQKDNLRLNTLIDDFGKAFNLSDALGKDVISGCSTFVRHTPEVLERLGGDAGKCDYIGYKEESAKWSDCLDKTREAREFRLELLSIAPNKPEFFKQTFCQFRQGITNTCRPILQKCESDDSFAAIVVAEEEHFAKLEMSVREVIPFFSFASQCPDEDGEGEDQAAANLRSALLGLLAGQTAGAAGQPRSGN